jgi:hypothetical protein
MAHWVSMFGAAWLTAVPAERHATVSRRVVELTRPRLFRDGCWLADYRRLRLIAVKPLA